MTEGLNWIEKWSQRVLAWFSQREVKTPLAFYFRVVGATVVLVLFTLYFALPEQRLEIFIVGILMLLALATIVGLFAWLNVKNLVYGEAGHRAEMRFRFGTEKAEVPHSALATTPGTSNPNPLPAAEGALPEPGAEKS